jgi:hypothetical protein
VPERIARRRGLPTDRDRQRRSITTVWHGPEGDVPREMTRGHTNRAVKRPVLGVRTVWYR